MIPVQLMVPSATKSLEAILNQNLKLVNCQVFLNHFLKRKIMQLIVHQNVCNYRWGNSDGTFDIDQFAITDTTSSARLRFGCASSSRRDGRSNIHSRSCRSQYSFSGAKTLWIYTGESGRCKENGIATHFAYGSTDNHQQRPTISGWTHSSQRKNWQLESRQVMHS